MRNILVEIKYIGSNYCGFAFQKNGISIYSVLVDSLKKIFQQDIKIYGCSRTDAGVHANQYFFNFKIISDIKNKNIVNALNFFLPNDISCISCRDVKENFHAQFDAISKEYVYKIYNTTYRDPFLYNLALHYTYSINFELINKTCKKFIGKYDFKSFCSSNSSVFSTIRQIYNCDFNYDINKNLYFFRISANGFLYNMVRILFGTILSVNEGKIDYNDVDFIINSLDRRKAGPTLPPYALYLNKVEY